MFPTALALLVGLILVLAIPVDLVFALKRETVWHGRVIVGWLFGRARFSVRVKKTRNRRRRPMRRAGTRVLGTRRQLSAMLRSEGFVRRAAQLIVELLRAFKPRRFELQCVIGLDDPSDTGRLAALLTPLNAIAGRMRLGRKSKVAIQFSPTFSGPRFTGHCCTCIHFVPLKLLGIFLAFVFSRPFFRAAKAALVTSRRL